ncbi:hypothetical protein [Halorubrum tebenquichense]|uniref:Uncharacterized protein n=1 Tax=Halorubrum tebenquichense DSM 14210 TaxID=1227485 RepID=M0DLG3_9EURY|nr:hypothetical protein [Halorubrum tebenquichense]ELZ35527.1 hypothetical protein C472_11991 [Halorubrum tebenquichense DSM 14210]
MAYDPLSPSEALRTPAGIVLATLSLLVFAYSLVFVGQVLLGLVLVGLSASLYVSYRLFVALDSIADGAQRLADAREREVDATEDSHRTEGDEREPRPQTTSELTERER